METSWHSLLTCPLAQDCWNSIGLWNIIEPQLLIHESFAQIFFYLIRAIPQDDVAKFCMMLWSLWSRRNTKLWVNMDETAQECIHRGAAVFSSWNAARKSSAPQTLTPVVTNWMKPPPGFLKCNIDASFHEESGTTGYGICIRDHVGRFYMARTHYSSPLMGVREGEATALLLAINWLHQLEVDFAIVETDCKIIADSLNSSSQDLTEFGDLIKSCKDLLSLKQGFTIQFVKRQANMAAHTLARRAATHAWAHITSTVPTCIASIIFNEMR